MTAARGPSAAAGRRCLQAQTESGSWKSPDVLWQNGCAATMIASPSLTVYSLQVHRKTHTHCLLSRNRQLSIIYH